VRRRQQQPVVRLEPRTVHLVTKNRQLVSEHENLEILGSILAAEQHDQLQHRQTTTYKADTCKGDLQQTGTPTLPPPRQPSRLA
jgi:hypothetical protein